MTEQEALRKMIAPGTPRAGKYLRGVIQIHVTRACNLACYGCTQGSNLRGKTEFISLEHFEQACRSLEGYWGVWGLFGGCPTLHPEFPALCEILRKYAPFDQRGLWANALHGHGAVCRRTFAPHHSNLNVHLDRAAYDEFRRDWPESRPVGLDKDSRHSPPYVAMKDVVADEGERWKLIANCPINRHWSAMLGVFRGQVRAWFCEIAGAQAMLHQHEPDYPDTGLPAEPGWWKRPMRFFADQVRKHCNDCGVPLQGFGELAQAADGTEQTSATHAAIYQPKRPGRRVEVVTDLVQLGVGRLANMTRYLQNADL